MKVFTKEELKEYDGKGGKPTYLAYKGKVYDVSESYLWEDGEHQAEHFAGEDLTDEFKDAPHDEYVLERFPVVGELKEE
ncbi:MAG: cytochrome B5 [archaeon]|nr:cytochrome B5 [archaeon]MCP8306704.1 cytochrome B5 [archaeon]